MHEFILQVKTLLFNSWRNAFDVLRRRRNGDYCRSYPMRSRSMSTVQTTYGDTLTENLPRHSSVISINNKQSMKIGQLSEIRRNESFFNEDLSEFSNMPKSQSKTSTTSFTFKSLSSNNSLNNKCMSTSGHSTSPSFDFDSKEFKNQEECQILSISSYVDSSSPRIQNPFTT